MNLARVIDSPAVPAAAIGAGVLGLIGLWFVRRRTAEQIRTGGQIRVRLTTYFPYKAGLSEAQRRMEGGTKDRKGRPIYTWEEHVAGRAPYVSLAGDDAIWPYGQRVGFPDFPNVVARVVDTGGHFRGFEKVFRIPGHEPIDVAVNDENSRKRIGLPTTTVLRVAAGDNFEGGREVAYAKLPGAIVVGYSCGLEVLCG